MEPSIGIRGFSCLHGRWNFNGDGVTPQEIHDEAYRTPSEDIRQWERKAVAGLLGLLVVVFGAWAGVVWHGTDKVVARIDAVSAQIAADRLDQAKYQLLMERRLTLSEAQLKVVEQRQTWVIEALRTNDRKDIP